MALSDFDREHIEDILGGNDDWFSAQLIRLIAKADPVNLALIRLGFPDHVEAWESWYYGEEEVKV